MPKETIFKESEEELYEFAEDLGMGLNLEEIEQNLDISDSSGTLVSEQIWRIRLGSLN